MTPAEKPVRILVGRAAHDPSDAVGDAAGPCQTPRIDIHEEADGLVLEADLPGATAEGLTVTVDGHVLALHARVAAPLPPGVLPLLEESPLGTFAREFILSDEVDRDRITADLSRGVLSLRLPRAERARPRRIEIKTP